MTRRAGWTEERRERQRQAIQCWRPWDKSTGPRTKEGKERSSRNATRERELREVETYMQLLSLRRERDAGALGGKMPSPERLSWLQDEIAALEAALDPDSDLAEFLAESTKNDDDAFDPM